MYICSHISCQSIFCCCVFWGISLFASLLGSKENLLVSFMFTGASHYFTGIENWWKHRSIKFCVCCRVL